MDSIIKNLTTRFEEESSKLIEYNTPSLFVAYYSLQAGETVLDTHFQSTYETTGSSSGHVWNKYNNVPVYFAEQLTPQILTDERKGIEKKLVSTVVVPRRNLEFLSPKIGDAIYFTSIPDDYQQRLFFVSNVENADIQTLTHYKLTLTPHGGHTIDEINQNTQSNETFNVISKNLIDTKQYVKIQDFTTVIRNISREITAKSRVNSLPYVFRKSVCYIYISDLFYSFKNHILPALPNNWNNGYTNIFRYGVEPIIPTSLFNMLFDDSYTGEKYDFTYVTADYEEYEHFFCTIHPHQYTFAKIDTTGLDLILEIYQEDALKVHAALGELLNFRNQTAVTMENIDDSILMNRLIKDYIIYKKDGEYPEISKYHLHNQINTLELFFLLKIILELI